MVTDRVERARRAVAFSFALNGLAFASWAARTPAIKTALDLSLSRLGLLLLCLSAGAVAALPTSGAIVHRFAPARVVLVGSVSVACGLTLVALGAATGAVPVAGLGLFLMGAGSGSWDVAMNVEGADVERRLGRTLMPRLHAAFSAGTIVGAGIGAACAASGVPVEAQLAVTAAVVLAASARAVRAFLPVVEEPHGEQPSGRRAALQSWREPRTVLVGVMVLAFAFTEGSANDWLAVALVQGHDVSEATGAIGFGAFVTAMTASRLWGGALLERYGRVPVLQATAATALGGLLLVSYAGPLPLVLAGALLWGCGASLGFPVGMSAAADDPARAAVRVSVVGSIGYTAFLAGPPLIGTLADHVGVLRALLVVLAALVIGLAAAPAARPPRPASETPHDVVAARPPAA